MKDRKKRIYFKCSKSVAVLGTLLMEAPTKAVPSDDYRIKQKRTVLPYVKNTPEMIKRLLKPHGVEAAHKGPKILRKVREQTEIGQISTIESTGNPVEDTLLGKPRNNSWRRFMSTNRSLVALPNLDPRGTQIQLWRRKSHPSKKIEIFGEISGRLTLAGKIDQPGPRSFADAIEWSIGTHWQKQEHIQLTMHQP